MAFAGGGNSREPIDFADLAQALLLRAEVIVPQWLPGGRREGHEWCCGSLAGDAGSSCKVNLVTGHWADFAGGDDERGGDLISLRAAIDGINNGQAARRLMGELGWQTAPPVSQASAGSVANGPPGVDGRPEPPAEEPGAGAKTRRASLWRALVPVPANAPAPTFKHWHYTEVERSWEYRFEGMLYGHVVRFRTGDGGKEILPHTWCVDESDARGTRRWHWKQWDEPRPLYVPATLLSGDLSLPVVLVEGEKCAQAGHVLLGHEYDFVSWPGGSKAWSKAAWGWLKGRAVYMWPDCDAKRAPLNAAERQQGVDPESKPIKPEAKQPGMQAMVGIGSLLLGEHGCAVFTCPVPAPGKVSDGWDLADAIEQGWGPEEVRAFIRGARVFVAPDDAVRAKAGLSTPTPAGAGRSGAAASEDSVASLAWLAHLLTSQAGAVKPVRENVVLALDGRPDRNVAGITECAGLIRYNEFTNNVEKVRPAPWGTPAGDWSECDELMMGDWLLREHRMPSVSRQALEEAVLIVSRRHSHHPLRQQVEALRGQWDPRQPSLLDQWLRRVCLEEDEFDDSAPLQRYLALMGRWFVMGMCARVMSPVVRNRETVVGPGTKFDYMLVLEGPTGWGKSTLAKVLGGEHFADTGLDVTHKDSMMNIQGVRVYEWSELDQQAKQEIGAVKRFISSPSDRYRATFDRRPAKYPRQVVFVGTTEEANYLLDHKGNRRFWPVRLTRPPDLEWLQANLEQMQAEAVWRIDRGERFYPTRDEQRELFDPQQRMRAVESSLEAAMRYRLYDENQKTGLNERNYALVNRLSMTELLNAVGYAIDKQTDAVVKKAGSVLHMLGWVLKRTGLPGRPYVYERPAAEASPLGPPPAGSDGDADRSTPPQGQTPAREEPNDMPF